MLLDKRWWKLFGHLSHSTQRNRDTDGLCYTWFICKHSGEWRYVYRILHNLILASNATHKWKYIQSINKYLLAHLGIIRVPNLPGKSLMTLSHVRMISMTCWNRTVINLYDCSGNFIIWGWIVCMRIIWSLSSFISMTYFYKWLQLSWYAYQRWIEYNERRTLSS